MCAADNLESVANSLDEDIVVAGPKGDLGTVAERAEAEDQPRVVGTEDVSEFGDAVGDSGVIVVTWDGSSSGADATVQLADNVDGCVVAVFNGHEYERVEPSLLETVRKTVDVTLLACKKRPTEDSPSEREAKVKARARRSGSGVAAGGAFDFVRMLRRPGHVNLDLADARTVLTEGSIAVLSSGTATFETEGFDRSIQRAFEAVPTSIEATRGTGVLVSLVSGPEMSIEHAISVVRAVREEMGNIEELIWGVATDDALADQVTVDIVVDDIPYRPPLSAGDPCRRCGAALAVYTFGERTALACEVCGFADLSRSLGE